MSERTWVEQECGRCGGRIAVCACDGLVEMFCTECKVFWHFPTKAKAPSDWRNTALAKARVVTK